MTITIKPIICLFLMGGKMSLFMELCELCKEGKVEEFKQIVTEFECDIHEQDDLLLLIASETIDSQSYFAGNYGPTQQANKIEIVKFLLEHQANPTSRQGQWFKNIFYFLDFEDFKYYFDNFIESIELTHENKESNLFNLSLKDVNLIINLPNQLDSYFCYLVDKNYPPHINFYPSLELSLGFSAIEHFINSPNFESIIRRSYQLAPLELIQNKTEESFFNDMWSKYHTFPYVLDDEIKQILSEKKYTHQKLSGFLWGIRKLSFSFFENFYNQYPDYFDYLLKEDYFSIICHCSMEHIKLIARGQDLRSQKTENNQFVGYRKPIDKDFYMVSHCRLSNKQLTDFFIHGDIHIQEDIITCLHAVDDKLFLEKLAKLCHYLNIHDKEELLLLIRKKMNSSELDKKFLESIEQINYDLFLNFIQNPKTNLNCECGSALAIIVKKLKESSEEVEKAILEKMLELIVAKSHINSDNFSLLLDLKNEKYIEQYLNHSFDLSENIQQIFTLEDEKIVRHIIYQKRNELKNIILRDAQYFRHAPFLNPEALLFFSTFIEDIQEQNSYFSKEIVEHMFNLDLNLDIFKMVIAKVFNKGELNDMTNIISSGKTELLQYLIETKILILDNQAQLNSMRFSFDKIQSPEMLTLLLESILPNSSQQALLMIQAFSHSWEFVLNEYFKNKEFNFYEFVENHHDDYLLCCCSEEIQTKYYHYFFEKIVHYQPEKLKLLSERAFIQSTPMWQEIQLKIKAYEEQSILNQTILSAEKLGKTEKKKGKI